MIFHNLIETRNIETGDGNIHRQRRYYCSAHGWFDLFVFPDADTGHAKCNQIEQPAAVGESDGSRRRGAAGERLPLG